ncbi:MAG: hypothetical protein GY940_09615 [bacterium]|nr:hypothetical protein [bacterium]
MNNTDIKIKPQDIESVTVPQNSSSKLTIKMKQGETVKIRGSGPKIDGTQETGGHCVKIKYLG